MYFLIFSRSKSSCSIERKTKVHDYLLKLNYEEMANDKNERADFYWDLISFLTGLATSRSKELMLKYKRTVFLKLPPEKKTQGN